MSRRFVLMPITLILALSQPLQTMADTHPQASDQATLNKCFYKLTFPPGGMLGDVGAIYGTSSYADEHTQATMLGHANGVVKVPCEANVYFLSHDYMGLENSTDISSCMPRQKVTSICLNQCPISEQQLLQLLKFTKLRRIELSHTDIGDKSLARLAALPDLEAVIVNHSKTRGKFLIAHMVKSTTD